jgi:hypothetical protein
MLGLGRELGQVHMLVQVLELELVYMLEQGQELGQVLGQVLGLDDMLVLGQACS